MPHMKLSAHQRIDRLDYPDNAIFVFDFDGVLAHQLEDQVFRLPVENGDRERIVAACDYLNIDHRLYPDTSYLRHLAHQASAIMYTPDAHDPITEFARDLWKADEPFFIVTARSGLAAVSRLTAFLEDEKIHPQEVFCLGRVSKAPLIAEMRQEWSDRPIVYFEDSKKHIDAVVALADPMITVVEVVWEQEPEKAMQDWAILFSRVEEYIRDTTT